MNDAGRPRRIYFNDFAGLGSACLAVSVLRALEQADPTIRYAYPANPLLSDPRLRNASGLDGIISLTKSSWRRFDRADWADLAGFLVRERIDTVVNFRNPDLAADPQYADFRAACASLDVDVTWCDLYQFADLASQHVQERMCRLLTAAGLSIAPIEVDWLREARAWPEVIGSQLDSRPIVGLFCSASVASKRWPEVYWRRLMKLLARSADLRFEVYSGTSGVERDMAMRCIEEMPASVDRARVSLVPAGSVTSLVMRLSRLSVLVANDTGVGHVAAACGVPTVSLFLSTDPAVWKPGRASDLVLHSRIGSKCPAQRPLQGNCARHYEACEAPCHWDVEPEAVAQKVLQALS